VLLTEWVRLVDLLSLCYHRCFREVVAAQLVARSTSSSWPPLRSVSAALLALQTARAADLLEMCIAGNLRVYGDLVAAVSGSLAVGCRDLSDHAIPTGVVLITRVVDRV